MSTRNQLTIMKVRVSGSGSGSGSEEPSPDQEQQLAHVYQEPTDHYEGQR